jgi:DNA-binding transcriptional MerR regulator
MRSPQQFLSIQEVSKRLKVPKPTLRFWEKELAGIIVPLRSNGGQRRYTTENVSVIEEIKRMREMGMSLAKIKRRLGKGQISEVGSQTCPQRSRHARHREVQPRRTGLRGGRGSGNERTDRIGLLAERVAKVVRSEVLRFFEREEG